MGAKGTISDGADDDIICRLGKAKAAFEKVMNIWKISRLSNSAKIGIFKSNVIAVLLYGCESWRIAKGNEVRQTDNLYLSTMIIKAMQLMGSCINTKPINRLYAL